jgi:hypothetical protein
MTLAASGEISIGGSTVNRSINLELGRSATATSSLGETSLRTLAGVASGAISMSNFYNKSSGPPASFTPPGSTNSGTPEYYYIEVSSGGGTSNFDGTLTCNTTAVWTWSGPQDATRTVSVSSGGSSTTITFAVATIAGAYNSGLWNVTGSVGGYSQYFQISIIKDDTSSGGGGGGD